MCGSSWYGDWEEEGAAMTRVRSEVPASCRQCIARASPSLGTEADLQIESGGISVSFKCLSFEKDTCMGISTFQNTIKVGFTKDVICT